MSYWPHRFININIWQKSTALALVCSAILSGCANTKVADAENIHSQAILAAAKSQQTPQQLLAESRTLADKARSDNLGFFAPLHMQQALDSLAHADRLINNAQQQATVAKEAIAAKTFIENGYKNKALVEEHLKPALQQIEVLKQVDAPNLLPGDYRSSIDDLTFIIKMFEGGQITEGTNKQRSVIAGMINLEINALKKTHLSDALAFREKADDADAEEFAEVTLEAADKKIAEAQRYIETNYRDRLGVARQGREALQQTKQAYFVALDAQKLVKMDAAAAEQHVLRIVGALQKVAAIMDINELEANTFDMMADELRTKAGDVKQPKVSVSALGEASAIESEQIEAIAIESFDMETESVEVTDLAEPEITAVNEEQVIAPTEESATTSSIENPSQDESTDSDLLEAEKQEATLQN